MLLSAINREKFGEPATKEAVTTGIAFLERIAKTDIPDQNGMFSVISSTGKKTAETLTGACHGNLMSCNLDDRNLIATRSRPIKFLNRSYYGDKPTNPEKICSEEVLVHYYDWYANRSHASKYIIPMPADFTKEFGVLVSTDIPINLMMTCLQLTRHPREFYAKLAQWHYLSYDCKIDENLAFFIIFTTLSEVYYPSEDKGHKRFLASQFLTMNDGGHTIFAPFPIQAAKNWMNRDFANLSSRSYQQTTTWSGEVTKMVHNKLAPEYGNDGRIEYPKGNVYQVDVSKYVLEGGKKAEESLVPNPFAPKKAAKAITWNQFLNEGGIEFLMQQIEGDKK